MPRRNHRARGTWRGRRQVLALVEEETQPTPEQLARSLVKRGLASPLILDSRRFPIQTYRQRGENR